MGVHGDCGAARGRGRGRPGRSAGMRCLLSELTLVAKPAAGWGCAYDELADCISFALEKHAFLGACLCMNNEPVSHPEDLIAGSSSA